LYFARWVEVSKGPAGAAVISSGAFFSGSCPVPGHAGELTGGADVAETKGDGHSREAAVGAMGSGAARSVKREQPTKGDNQMRRILVLVALMALSGPVTIARADDAATGVVRLGMTDVIKATIHVGHLAEVAVLGDGYTDLDLYIYDPAGRLVGKDDDETDRCYVRFFPRTSGIYTIKIVNRSDTLSNAYVIAVR
jgi:hypothetical protein